MQLECLQQLHATLLTRTCHPAYHSQALSILALTNFMLMAQTILNHRCPWVCGQLLLALKKCLRDQNTLCIPLTAQCHLLHVCREAMALLLTILFRRAIAPSSAAPLSMICLCSLLVILCKCQLFLLWHLQYPIVPRLCHRLSTAQDPYIYRPQSLHCHNRSMEPPAHTTVTRSMSLQLRTLQEHIQPPHQHTLFGQAA